MAAPALREEARAGVSDAVLRARLSACAEEVAGLRRSLDERGGKDRP